MPLHRRNLLLASTAALCLSAWSNEVFPSQPIKLIISFPPGSTSDLLARFLGEKLGKALGQPVIVESKIGAQGVLAARHVVKSPKDGYTLFLGTNSTHAANLYLMKNLGYDPVKDFTPITQCVTNPLLLVVRSDMPAKTVTELVQHAKANPGKLSYGTGNTGSLVAAQLFKSQAGVDAVGVSYPGVVQACTDLVGGRLDFMMVDPLVVRPFVEAGKLRILGITSAQRLSSLPDVAPLAELGLPHYRYVSWAGFFGPAGLPEAITQRLNQTLVAILSEPETEKYLSGLGILSARSSPAEFKRFVQEQITLWARLSKDSGLEMT
jgi:tripartite-type tricarboxylate transporter receptor subunit TctC